MFGLGPSELLLVLLLVFFMFGAKRIPEIARGFGKGISEFKKATHEVPDKQKPSSFPSSDDSQSYKV